MACRFMFLLLVLLPGQVINAQLKEIDSFAEWKLIGQVKYAGPAKASLKYLKQDSDTSYLLLMRDDRYELREFFSIRFESKDETLKNFHDLLMSFFDKENRKDKDYDRTFQLGSEMVHVQHMKRLTGAGIMLTTNDGYIIFTRGELDKLFGKQ